MYLKLQQSMKIVMRIERFPETVLVTLSKYRSEDVYGLLTARREDVPENFRTRLQGF